MFRTVRVECRSHRLSAALLQNRVPTSRPSNSHFQHFLSLIAVPQIDVRVVRVERQRDVATGARRSDRDSRSRSANRPEQFR